VRAWRRFADLCELIAEGDQGCEQSIRSVLGHFRVSKRGKQFGTIERAIELCQAGPAGLIPLSDDDSVGIHEIRNRRAFAKEFRIRAQTKRARSPARSALERPANHS